MKNKFFEHFVSHIKFLTFCMTIEGNRGHHMNMLSYIGKVLIRGGEIKCLIMEFLEFFSGWYMVIEDII